MNIEELQEAIRSNLSAYSDKVKTGIYTVKLKSCLYDFVESLGISVDRPEWLDAGNDKTDFVQGELDMGDQSRQEEMERWVREWAKSNGVEIFKEYRFTHQHHPNAIALCVCCPWWEEHSVDGGAKESVIIIDLNGRINYLCRHSHCYGRGWKNYRKQIETKKWREMAANYAKREA